MRPIVSIIEDVVKRVQVKWDAENGEKPYFMHGHPKEIVSILSKKTRHGELKFKKFPAICLFQDFQEVDTGNGIEASLNLVIVDETRPEFEASERYNDTFIPVLYPIYEMFMREYERMPGIHLTPANINPTKTDRLYWGRTGLYGNEANIANDFIDAIEIENLNFRTSKRCQL